MIVKFYVNFNLIFNIKIDMYDITKKSSINDIQYKWFWIL